MPACRVAATDFADVAPISGSECGAIDAFRLIRATGTQHLSVPQRKFEMAEAARRTANMPGRSARARSSTSISPIRSRISRSTASSRTATISPLVADRADFDDDPQDGQSDRRSRRRPLPHPDRCEPYRLVGHHAADRQRRLLRQAARRQPGIAHRGLAEAPSPPPPPPAAGRPRWCGSRWSTRCRIRLAYAELRPVAAVRSVLLPLLDAPADQPALPLACCLPPLRRSAAAPGLPSIL